MHRYALLISMMVLACSFTSGQQYKTSVGGANGPFGGGVVLEIVQ